MVLKEDLVSIVMCTYNRADFIRQTIESIQDQTFTNWELLVMDNGSTDNTKEVIDEIADGRISYHRFDPTSTGRLRNIAFSKAWGNYIALMDSDDLWLPEKLQKQIDLLKENPEIKFSFTNSQDFIGDLQVVHTLNQPTTGTAIQNAFLPMLRSELFPPIQTFLFEKECLDVCGRFRETRIFNDYEFIGKLCYHFDAAILYEPLLLRRLHQTNSINIYSDELAQEYMEAVRLFRKEKMIQASLANQLLYTTAMNTGNVYLLQKQWQKAINIYLAGWQYKPFSMVPLKKLLKTILHLVSR